MDDTQHFLSVKQKEELKQNIDLTKLSNSDIEFIYDLYITKYPVYKAFDGKLVSDVINADLGTNITPRQIESIRDISLKEEILDNKLLMNNLGYFYTEGIEDIYE